MYTYDVNRNIKTLHKRYAQEEFDKNRTFGNPNKTIEDVNIVNIVDIYIELDTTNRIIGDSDLSKGIFSFKFDTDNQNSAETIGITEAIDHCIAIESYTFLFPRIPLTRYELNETGANKSLPILKNNGNLTPQDVDLSQINIPRFTIELKEAGNQSISTADHSKYTLQYDLLNVEGDDSNLAATYAAPSIVEFNFTNVAPKFDRLTLNFRNYFNEPISFNNDMILNTFATANSFVYDASGPVMPNANEEYFSIYGATAYGPTCAYAQGDYIRTGDTINIKNYDTSVINTVLYNYLSANTTKLRIGNVDNVNFQLNPDISITEYIQARSSTYNVIMTNVKNMKEFITKIIPIKAPNQIVLKEWNILNRPAPFTNIDLNGFKSFKNFSEGEYFYIDNNKYTPRNGYINYKGDTYWIEKSSDIYYNKVVFTKKFSNTVKDNIDGNHMGVLDNIHNTNVAVSTDNKILLKDCQVFMPINSQTDLTDTYYKSYAMFNNNKLKVGSSIRLLHQGADVDGITPLSANDVYHIQSLDHILANGIILTRGLAGFSKIDIILENNVMKIPIKFRTVSNKVSNYLYA